MTDITKLTTIIDGLDDPSADGLYRQLTSLLEQIEGAGPVLADIKEHERAYRNRRHTMIVNITKDQWRKLIWTTYNWSYHTAEISEWASSLDGSGFRYRPKDISLELTQKGEPITTAEVTQAVDYLVRQEWLQMVGRGTNRWCRLREPDWFNVTKVDWDDIEDRLTPGWWERQEAKKRQATPT
jgi:hypothetical protein